MPRTLSGALEASTLLFPRGEEGVLEDAGEVGGSPAVNNSRREGGALFVPTLTEPVLLALGLASLLVDVCESDLESFFDFATIMGVVVPDGRTVWEVVIVLLLPRGLTDMSGAGDGDNSVLEEDCCGAASDLVALSIERFASCACKRSLFSL